MISNWWQASPTGRLPLPAAAGRLPDDEVLARCHCGAILVAEEGGRLAFALDPAWPHEPEALRLAVSAAIGPAAPAAPDGQGPALVLRLATAAGWHDIPAGGIDALLQMAAAWTGLARPPLWSTSRFAVAGGRAAALGPDKGIALPPWILEVAGQPLDSAAALLAAADRHAAAVEAVLAEAVPAAGGTAARGTRRGTAGGGTAGQDPPFRYRDHHRPDGLPAQTTVPQVGDWIREVLVMRHAIVAAPAQAVTQRSQQIVVCPILHSVDPTLHLRNENSAEPAVGVFVLIYSRRLKSS